MKKKKISINEKAWKENKPSKNDRNQLANIIFDKSMERINDKLSNIRGMTPITYESIEKKLEEANANLEALCYYIDESMDDIKELIDEPFFQSFDSKNGVLEAFERIKLDDYQVKNELGIKEYGTNKIYHHPTGTFEDQDYAFEKDTIGIQDIINNMDIKGSEGAPSFAEMMRHNFEACEDLEGQDFDEYVETLVHRSDITHTVDRGWLNFLSDTLDTIGIVSAVAIFTGTDFVTGEILTDEERENALFNTAINVGFLLLTIATSGIGASLALGTKTAIKQTAYYVVKASAADMVTGLAGLATMNVLDLIGSPKELSMFLGLAASFIAGNKINNKIDTGKGASNISTTEEILDEASEIKKHDLSEQNEIALEILNDSDSSVIKGASGAKTISKADRAKIDSWKLTPDDELYLKYKDVYDNPKYFDQQTGNVKYPGEYGDINENGFINGKYIEDTLQPGTIIDRYGSNGTGKFFSPEGTPYGDRALPPFMENQPYTKYEILKPMKIKSGEIAPWFGQPGGGKQFLSDFSVDELRDMGIIRIIE